MKRLTKRCILVFVSAVISVSILCGTVTAKSSKSIGVELPTKSVFSKNIHLFSNGSAGFLLLSTDGATTNLTFLNNDGSIFEENGKMMAPISLDYAYNTAEIHNGKIYIVGSIRSNPSSTNFGIMLSSYQLGQIQKYSDSSYTLSNIENSSLQGFTADGNGNVYMINSLLKNTLSIFNSNSLIEPVIIPGQNGNFTSVCVSPDNYLYVTYASGGKIGIINTMFGAPTTEPRSFFSDIPAIPYRFLSDTTVMDATGVLFHIQGAPPVFRKVKDIHGSSSAACALSSGDILSKTGPRTAGKFASDGTLISEYKFDGELLDLAANGTTTAAIVSDGGTLRFVDLSKPTTNGEEESSSVSGESGSSSCTSSQAESTPGTSSEVLSTPAGSDPSSNTSPVPTSIQSTVYPIDRSANLLYVGTSTSFAQLKNSIPAKGAALRAVKPNGSILESGSIGTGTTIELVVDGKVVDSLKAVVKGDLVGSGNITSRDEHLLYAHLNSGNHLSGVYLRAADMNNDNIVDTSDLLLLKKRVSAS